MEEIDVEKAGGQLGNSTDPHELKSGTQPKDEVGGQRTTADSGSDEPRRNAKMWSTYIEEAEKEAKELAEISKNGLESLLVFAGLFAGVVASFVIDSRRDLQPDPQQVLLAEIRNALRNETTPQDTFKPSNSAVWINGLWFTSLMITLFSAIVGVLAKSWLVKFTPVVSGKESEGAYRRYIRDRKAKNWYLEQIITAAPLLIQLALCLFALGFGVQSVGDNPTLGWGVMASVFTGIVLYIIATLLPLFIPWCPLQTPLSDILSGALFSITSLYQSLFKSNPTAASRRDDTRTHLSWRDGPDKKEVLSIIWHNRLIQSAKPSNVDEALAELSQVKLSDWWWQRFVEWDVPAILRQRLQESTLRTRREYQYEVLCNHLRSLLGFVHHLGGSAPKLSQVLGSFLESGNPLSRWNVFPEEIRALAFSARTPIMIACNEDYTSSEMEERPWEAMVRHLHQDHRRNFAMAACRGLVGGKDGLRKVSALSIATSIAKANIAGIGPKSEWGVGINKAAKSEAERLGQQYLEKLFKEIVNGWKMLLLETSGEIPPSPYSNSWGTTIWSSFELGHQDSRVRTRAITMLEIFATDVDFHAIANSSIHNLAKMVVNDLDEDVRAKATEVLVKFTQNGKFRNFNKKVLSSSLSSALRACGSEFCARAIGDIARLIQHPKLQNVFRNNIRSLTYYLIYVTVHTKQEAVFAAGMKALVSLVQDATIRDRVRLELQANLRQAFRQSAFPDNSTSVENEEFINRAVMLLQNSGLQNSINLEIPQLAKLAMGQKDPEQRIIRMKALILLSQGDDVPRSVILSELPKILDILWHDIPQHCCICWIDILLSVFGYANFQGSIKSAIPTLLSMTMNGTNEDIHMAGVKALASLAEPFQHLILQALPSILQPALMPVCQGARTYTLNTLTRLINDVNIEVTGSAEAIIHVLIHVVVNDDDNHIRAAVVKLLSTLLQGVDLVSLSFQKNLESAFKKANWHNGVHIIDTFVKNSQFQDTILLAIPNLLDMMATNKDVNAQTAGVRLVAYLVQDDMFRDIIRPIVPNVLDLAPKDLHWQVQIAWFETLVVLAKNSNFQSLIMSVLPKFVDIATKDNDERVHAAGLKFLASIAPDDNFRSIIEPGFTEILHSAANDPRFSLQISWAEVQVMLSLIPNYQDYVQSGIPKLVSMVARSTSEAVRLVTVRSLITLACDGTSQTIQGVIKSVLPKVLDSARKDPNWEVRIAWIDALARLAHISEFRDNLHLTIPKLVERITYDEEKDVRIAGMKALTSLVQDSELKKLQDTIVSALPKSLNLVFDDPVLHADWVLVLDILIRRDIQLADIIMPAVPRIASIIIQGGDTGIRDSMIGLLALLASNDIKLQDIISSALSTNLDLGLKSRSWNKCNCAIEALSRLVPYPVFHNVVKLVMPQLLKMAVNDIGLVAHKATVESLNAIQKAGYTVILAIPQAITMIAPEAHVIRQVIDSLLHLTSKSASTDPELTAKSMEHILKEMLKGSWWLARATAAELFGALRKYVIPQDPEWHRPNIFISPSNPLGTYFLQAIQSAIPDIITLALEDKEDDVRAAGIRSLINLAEEDAFRDKIKAFLPQLIQLVEVSDLRNPVTELISLLAVDDIVRKDIISRILNPLIGPKTGVYPDGLLELLSRLIIDKRLSRQLASDEAMLSVASVLLMQPGADNHRFKVAAALWCNYGALYTGHSRERFSDDFVGLFLFTIFGRHVTLDEANEWRLMGSHLLSTAVSNPAAAAVIV